MSDDTDRPAEAKAADTPAEAAARAWLHAYGVHTEMYLRDGVGHPAMRSLPQAFKAFAAIENERLRAELAASAEALEMVDAAIKYWCDGSMNEIIQSDLLSRAARCTAAAKRAREASKQ